VTGSGPGRGAWLCAGRPDCLDAAVQRGGLARALRTAVDADAVETLRRHLTNGPHGGPPGDLPPDA
jgi:predicted RNA-binding protein YlxR (DUF448 family)